MTLNKNNPKFFRTALLFSIALHTYAISVNAQFEYRQKASENKKVKQPELIHLARVTEPPAVSPVKSPEEPLRVSRRYFHTKIKMYEETAEPWPKKEPPPETGKEKITEFKDLSPKEMPIFLDYYQTIRKKIRRMIVYPYPAKKNFVQGAAELSFVLLNNGSLKEIEIKRSSGHQLLDRNASWSIKRASPFPPFPDGLSQRRLRLNVQITYKLN